MRRDRLIIGLAYALAWGALVVNRGFYWDDWTLVGLSPASLVDGFRELGMPWFGLFFAALFSLPLPGLIGHIVAFLAYLASALILHAVLCRIPGLSRMDALVAAFTVAVLPVNYARIAVIDLPYGLSLLAFLAATWLLVRHVEVGGLARRLAALGLFLSSFLTASLLVLYVVPLALAGYLVWKAGKVPLRSFVLRHVDFLVLPVAYWLVKSAFFLPSGVYEGYNALTVRGLTQVPKALVSVPYDVLVEPFGRALTVAGFLGVAVGILVARWFVRRSRIVETGDFVSAPPLALAGMVLLGLGVFAYLAVGREPVIWDWSSRHQLLVPLGAGLLAAAAARGLRGGGLAGRVAGLGVGVLLGIAIVADARTLFAYQADWFKQTALIEAARTIPEVRTATHITVDDTATDLDVLRRTYRFYEYNAMFGQALGDTRRLVSNGVNDPDPDTIDRFIARPAYHMGQYVPTAVDLRLRVSDARRYPDPLEILRLVALEAIGSPSFEPEVSGLIDVTPVPITGSAPAP